VQAGRRELGVERGLGMIDIVEIVGERLLVQELVDQAQGLAGRCARMSYSRMRSERPCSP
jgi:hypothetical protein